MEGNNVKTAIFRHGILRQVYDELQGVRVARAKSRFNVRN